MGHVGQKQGLTHTGGIWTSSAPTTSGLKSKPPDRVVSMLWKLKKKPFEKTLTVRGTLLNAGRRGSFKGGTCQAERRVGLKACERLCILGGFHFLLAWRLIRCRRWPSLRRPRGCVCVTLPRSHFTHENCSFHTDSCRHWLLAGWLEVVDWREITEASNHSASDILSLSSSRLFSASFSLQSKTHCHSSGCPVKSAKQHCILVLRVMIRTCSACVWGHRESLSNPCGWRWKRKRKASGCQVRH